MGYSSTVKASFKLEAIMALSEFDIDSPNYKYFVEIGKENKDGAITGAVYELINAQRQYKKAGNFRIDKDGVIVRFPGVPKKFHVMLEIACIERYDRDYNRYAINF